MNKTTRVPAIWQPSQPVFWLFAVLFFVAGVMMAIEIAVAASEPNSALAALLLVAVQTALLWLIARAMPRRRTQPLSLRLAAFAWGAVIAATVAAHANSSAKEPIDALGLGSFVASITAPVNEDLLRLLGVLLVLTLASARPLTVMDGALYGFLVGAGFEVIENFLYALHGDDFVSTVTTGIQRLLVGFGLHALWTTLAGAALAYCLSRRQAGLSARWWALVPAVLVPMLLHAAWDAPAFSIFAVLQLLSFAVLYLLSLAVFFFGVRWGRRSEAVALSGSATEATGETVMVEAEQAN